MCKFNLNLNLHTQIIFCQTHGFLHTDTHMRRNWDIFFWCSPAYLWVVYQVFLVSVPAESDRQIVSLLIFWSSCWSILNPEILSLTVSDSLWNFLFYLFLSAVFFHMSTCTYLFKTTISKSFEFLPGLSKIFSFEQRL